MKQIYFLFHLVFSAAMENRETLLLKLRRAIATHVPPYQFNKDPDKDYVLTTDNAKKMLAIYQRLRLVSTIQIAKIYL